MIWRCSKEPVEDKDDFDQTLPVPESEDTADREEEEYKLYMDFLNGEKTIAGGMKTDLWNFMSDQSGTIILLTVRKVSCALGNFWISGSNILPYKTAPGHPGAVWWHIWYMISGQSGELFQHPCHIIGGL